jgi:dTDP-4-dehydrorhamnose 3,5-epimerase
VLFAETPLNGAFVLKLEKHRDDRGYFARTFCVEEFKAHGLNSHLVQCSTAFNIQRGTLRGFHWQASPKTEEKLVRVTRGAIHDVIVDLRTESPTYLQHAAIELSADNGRMLYIPKGFAHGLQTLADNTEVFYQMSESFAPDCSRGARWNDPAFGVEWPLPNPVLNERDRTWEDFSP